ncbi:MAG: hypothetical protein CMI61_08365 [Parvibaculum sp.]|nr:hypothetical protein [Parvibaculum sp.]|tara:strand:- start:1589 stop:1810 length:222 start_codon:yes stop_codon:yes gene_type:complete
MNRFHKQRSGKETGAAEQKMQQSTTYSEIRRRVEPILDASGTLKRHVMSKVEKARFQEAEESAESGGHDREER